MVRKRLYASGEKKWTGDNWWDKLISRRGGSGRLNAVVVKITTLHHMHYLSAVQFIENLIRYGDHAAAFEACNPPVRHQLSIMNIAVHDARRTISSTMTNQEKKAQRKLRAVRRIIREEPPERAVEMITDLIGYDDPEGADSL